jgi:FtsH ternary system domain X6
VSSSEAPPIAPAPKQVSRFEANLLRILRSFFQQAPVEEAAKLVREVLNRPKCLSPAAVHLVRDTLSKGCVLFLVRAGGWKKERFLRQGEPKSGRLWERGPVGELGLRFSRHTLDFLIWLTANRPYDTKPIWQAPTAELTVADRLILFLAYESLREEPDIAGALQSSPSFAESALCRIFYPGDFLGVESARPVAFADWFSGTGSLILESLQSLLETRWLEIERGKGQLGDWERMRKQGEAEMNVLGQFLDAAEHAKRQDLARFLLGVLSKVLATPDMTATFWTGGLQGNGPPRLAERLATQQSALALLRSSERFRRWERQARTSGYLDDDYAAAKFWLGEWERLNGAQTTMRADQIVQTLEPLRAPTSERTQ